MRLIGRLGRSRRRMAFALVGAVAMLTTAVAAASAHPLGNFTINHYAGLRVSAQAIALDVVIDFAEIPAFTERQRIDADGDGALGPSELEAERAAACPRIADDLRLTVDGRRLPLTAIATGLSEPAGVGGLPTLRLVCQYAAELASPLTGSESIRFEDRSFDERIGWREIVVLGDATTVAGTGFVDAAVSNRLTAYPTDLLASPLDQRSATFTAAPGGAPLPEFQAPDATPLATDSGPSVAGVPSPAPAAPRPDPSAAPAPMVVPAPPATTPATPTVMGAIPGGVTDDLAALIAARDLTPIAILGSLLVALALGALHALSPGHGKTVMAAYLVGSRGSTRHAVALGLSVTVSHTIGVLALALLTVAGASVIAPERLYPILGVVSGTLVIAIGLWLLYGRFRALAITRAHERAHAEAHVHGRDHEHDHHHEHEHRAAEPELEHRHGPFRHRHVPQSGGDLTWRSLFALGLAGGLVPSASALLLLLGSLSAGRPAYGVVLVVAFGLGMALVLGGVGILLVHAGRILESVGPSQRWHRLWALLPAATAVVVVGAGIWMTTTAIQTAF